MPSAATVLRLVNKFIVGILYDSFRAKVSLVKIRHDDIRALSEGKLYEFSRLL
jgi:hypothetical protein